MMGRIVWYNQHNPQGMREIDPTQLISMTRTHTLTSDSFEFTSLEYLPKGARLLYRETATSSVSEYVITSIDTTYENGQYIHTYAAPWSLYVDLSKNVIQRLPYRFVTLSGAISAAVQDTPWGEGIVTTYPDTEMEVDESSNYIGKSGWSAITRVYERMYSTAEYNILAKRIIPTITMASDGETISRRTTGLSIIDDRPITGRYGMQFWLEAGKNIKTLTRSVPSDNVYSWNFVLANDDAFINNSTSSSEPYYIRGYANTRCGPYSVPYSGEQKTYQSATVIKNSEYTAEEAEASSTIKANLIQWATKILIDANSSFAVEYKVETVSDSTDRNTALSSALQVGQVGYIVLPGLPSYYEESGDTRQLCVVSGVTTNILSGEETYDIGMPSITRIPRIQQRKDYQ